MNKVSQTIVPSCVALLLLATGCVSDGNSGGGDGDDVAQTDITQPQNDVSQPNDTVSSVDASVTDVADPGQDSMAADTSVEADTTSVDTTPPGINSMVTLVTSMGEFTIELKLDEAPITTANFLKYVGEGFYDGDDGLGATTFHRIIKGFMIQGGGLRADMSYKDVHPEIVNESTNGLKNIRGSVAMARKTPPNTATSQFFVNHVDNDFLDYAGPDSPGYAVFGHVIEGMDVVDAIAEVETNQGDMPFTPIEILDVFN